MPVIDQGWVYDTLTASSWGTQENEVGGLRVDAPAGGINGQKDPSATDKAGAKKKRRLAGV